MFPRVWTPKAFEAEIPLNAIPSFFANFGPRFAEKDGTAGT